VGSGHQNPDKSISRRQFFRLSGLLAGLAALRPGEGVAQLSLAKPRVVHTCCSRAASWDFLSGWYGDFVDQTLVSGMVDRGVMELTGRRSRQEAWQALIPEYAPGQKVAIKVNLNNAHTVGDSDSIIDALMEPVNAVVVGLKEIGVAESDIWVYDAVRSIPTRFENGCDYPGVHFSGDYSSNSQGFSNTDVVSFHPPAGGPTLDDQPISNVLVNANYLINIPIMKMHMSARVTLSFKNHFGSIVYCAALHEYTYPGGGVYTSQYSPLVDIYKSPQFGGKTVLTIGDGLYGSLGTHASTPQPWVTFGGASPCSLFFSEDPVAVDSVMYDFLEAEAGFEINGDDYLALASQAGLGVFEHRSPGASSRDEWYDQIDYAYVDLDTYVNLLGWWRDGAAHLSWNKPSHPQLAGYRVRYLSNSGADPDQGPSPVPITDPNHLTYELTGLTQYCLYELWIEPHDGDGVPVGESNHVSLMNSDIVQHFPLVSAG
jgi:hypothetical protein